MPNPVELTLSSLLPTYAISLLPPELIDLSTSLLAQSRSKAGTLKPEEEIARTYACCHIACQRLGHKLALDIAKPAPPAKPKVYNKLHAYFNSVLATPKTPRKRDGAAQSASKTDATATTPSARTSAARTKPATPLTIPSSAIKRSRRHAEPSVPEYVMPMIRHICKSLSTPEIAPHAFAGVQSIIHAQATASPTTASRKSYTPKDSNRRIAEASVPTIISTVINAVFEKLYPSIANAQWDERHRILNAQQEFCDANKGAPTLDHKTLRDAVSAGDDNAGFAAPKAWFEMEWYQNVELPQSAADGAAGDEGDDDSIRTPARRAAKTPLRREEKRARRSLGDDEEEQLGAAGLLPGMGTMFQPALDWLGDERVASSARWRDSITAELAWLEQRA